jgi:hypothetical protein
MKEKESESESERGMSKKMRKMLGGREEREDENLCFTLYQTIIKFHILNLL